MMEKNARVKKLNASKVQLCRQEAIEETSNIREETSHNKNF